MTSIIWLPTTLLLLASIQDLRSREVSNAFAFTILLSAMVAIAAGWWQLSWLACGLGILLGLLVSLPLFLLDGFGGGDVKLIAALGAWFGPIALLAVLFWIAVCGGVLAAIAKLRGKTDLAYVPAIAAGTILHALWPRLLM